MQRRNAPRARRPNPSHGNFGSNMSDRQGALMSRPSPFVSDVSPFGGDSRGSFGGDGRGSFGGDGRGSFAEDRSFGNDRSFAIERPINDRAFGNERPAPFAASEGNLHLQELDLELALLKRKRQIIEEQQQLLGHNDSYRPQKNGPPSLMQNFSSFYNDPPSSTPHGAKRRGDGPWEGSYPKRFSESRRSPPRAQIRPAYDRPKPAFARPADKPRARPAPRPAPRPTPAPAPEPRPSRPRSRNFNPTKVTKPKETFKPLSAYPAPQRKFLARQAAGLVREQEKDEDFLLTADKAPTPRMIGRLELGLGIIFKDIHKLHLDKKLPPLAVQVLRTIKQTIRDRIREVMVGKVVGKCTNIVDTYRAKYPAATDKEVLESAEAKYAAFRKLKYIDAESPIKYFRANMGRLLNSKLSEMVEKLKGLRNKEQLQVSIEQTLEEMKEADIAKIAEAESQAEAQVNAENDAATTESTEEGKVENGENKETEEEKASDDKKTDGGDSRPSYRSRYYEKLMEDLIKYQLPDILPQFKEQIQSLFDIDEEYNKTKASITMKTEEIASRIADEIKSLEDPEAKVVLKDVKVKKIKETAVNKNEPRSVLYFVKVLGRPHLPKRPAMQGFLDQYHPRAIKRHRTVKNMLFIGFKDKADFDKMLKANKSVVANCTLDIRVSERTKLTPKGDKKDQNNSTANDSTAADDSTATVEKELDTELDNQIDDLLTSIRQEEEKNEVPDEEINENAEDKPDEVVEPIENADKSDNWENGDGDWNENNEETWEDGDGNVETVASDKPEENGAGDAVESKADDTVSEVVEINDDDGKEETQSTETASKITTRRSTRTRVTK